MTLSPSSKHQRQKALIEKDDHKNKSLLGNRESHTPRDCVLIECAESSNDSRTELCIRDGLPVRPSRQNIISLFRRTAMEISIYLYNTYRRMSGLRSNLERTQI